MLPRLSKKAWVGQDFQRRCKGRKWFSVNIDEPGIKGPRPGTEWTPVAA